MGYSTWSDGRVPPYKVATSARAPLQRRRPTLDIKMQRPSLRRVTLAAILCSHFTHATLYQSITELPTNINFDFIIAGGQ